MVSAESKGGAQRVACQVASGLSESFNVLLLFGTGPQHCFPLSDKVVLRHFPKLLYDPFEIIKCRIVKTLKKRLRIDISISLLLSMNRQMQPTFYHVIQLEQTHLYTLQFYFQVPPLC